MTFNYFYTKAAFELAVNAFRKSFSTWPVCLVAMENRIFRKLKSIWPKFYSFDPEIVLHFHFTFKPFPGHAQKRDIVYLFSNRENVTGFDDFFFWVLSVFLYWGMNEIIYLFGNQENVRKCVFYGIFKNTTKHQKIFFKTFFEMQPNTWKYFPFRK